MVKSSSSTIIQSLGTKASYVFKKAQQYHKMRVAKARGWRRYCYWEGLRGSQSRRCF